MNKIETKLSKIFTVETGLENKPAIKLYRKLHFQETQAEEL